MRDRRRGPLRPDRKSLRRSATSSRCSRCDATAARFSSASTASRRRSGLRERSDGRQQLLQQAGLAVRRGLEHAQVAPGDAVARELGAGAHDLAVRVVVDLAALARLRP